MTIRGRSSSLIHFSKVWLRNNLPCMVGTLDVQMSKLAMQNISLIALFASILSACEGVVVVPKNSSSLPGSDTSEEDESQLPSRSLPDLPPPIETDLIPITATNHPLLRLTHRQWDAAVKDTLGLAQLPDFSENGLRVDRGSTFLFGQAPDTLTVDKKLFDDYRARAHDIAMYIAGSIERSQTLLGGDVSRERVGQLVIKLGLRAYRRPLTTTEFERHLALYDAGYEYPDTKAQLSAEHTGFYLTLRGFFENPKFLYRVASWSTNEASDATQLDAYALASKIAYFLTDQNPDQTLLELAASDDLVDINTLDNQVRRLMDTDAFEARLVSFHDATLGGTGAFVGDIENLRTAASTERKLFVLEAFRNNESWADMLLSPKTFVNSQLADIYNLSGDFSPNNFQEVLLPASERLGLLTQIAFLGGVKPTPIHRGVWLSKHILCNEIGAAANNGNELEQVEPGDTPRETYVNVTEKGTCAGCHVSLINPFGFAFEAFNKFGSHRTDYGENYDYAAVDTNVENASIDGTQRSANNARDMITQIANSTGAHFCYAKHLTEFALGRTTTESDTGLIEHLAALSAEGRPVKDLFRFLILSKSFRFNQNPKQD